MGEIRDSLVVDISQPLRAVGELELALNRALADTEVTVDTSGIKSQLEALDTDLDQLEATGLSRSFDDAEQSARQTAQVTGEIATEADQAEEAWRRIADATNLAEDQARDLAQGITSSVTQTDLLEANVARVAKSMGLSEKESRDFAASVRRAGDDTARADAQTQNLSKSWQRVRGFIVAAVAAIGVRGLVNQFNEAVQASANLAESQNAVNVVFGDAARTIFPAAEEAATRFGLSTRALNENATQMGASLQNAGFSAEEAAEKFLELQLRASDTASVLNTDVNEVLVALQAALRGEFDPIERFTGGMNQATVQARALSLGLIEQGEELDNNARALAVTALFMERTNKFAGDFANTSDSVANRQRTLQAAFENTRAEVGEALIPAFESLLDLTPQVTQVIVDMIPALTNAGQSFADFLEDADPVLSRLSQIQQGFGLLSDSATLAVTPVRQGLETVFALAQGRIGDAAENVFELGRAMGDLADRGAVRVTLIAFQEALLDGADASDTFRKAIDALAESDLLDESTFAQFASTAGLADDELTAVTQTLLDNADAASFNASELAVLRFELAKLGRQATAGELAGITRIDPDAFLISPEILSAFRTDLEAITVLGQTAFGSLAGFIDDTGQSVAEFVLAGAPIPDFLQQTRTEAELTGAVFFATAEATRELADDLESRLGTAVPEIASIFEGAVEEIEQSTEDIIANISEQITQTAQFEANLVTLVARGQVALANALLEAGPASSPAAAAFVDNVEEAIIAEDLLTGATATTKAEEARLELATALAEIDLSPEGRLALLSFAEGLSDPAVLAEILAATGTIASTTVAGLKGGLQIRSPSRVMMELGAFAAEGFYLGLEQGIRAPAIPNFGVPSTSTTGGTAVGPSVTNNFFTEPNPTTDTMRIAQTTRSLMQ